MTKSKSRNPDTSKHARPKPRHGKRRESGTRKAAPCKVVRRPRAAVFVASNEKNQTDTKQAKVIAMLRAPSGATIDAIMQVTGWQQHSVRGFLTAVIRKKFGLDLRSEITDGGRVYRVVDRLVAPAVDTRAKTAA